MVAGPAFSMAAAADWSTSSAGREDVAVGCGESVGRFGADGADLCGGIWCGRHVRGGVDHRRAAGLMSFDWRGMHVAVDLIRRERGLTWKDVAKQTGVGESSLSRWRHGRTELHTDALADISVWSGVGLDQFVAGHEVGESTMVQVARALGTDTLLDNLQVGTLVHVNEILYAEFRRQNAAKA